MDYFRSYKMHNELLKETWHDIPKNITLITESYYKDVKEAPAYDKAVPFGNGVLYKHTVLDYDNCRFRDEYITSDWSHSGLDRRGLPSDVTPQVKRFAYEKWCHSRTYFTLAELWDAVEKSGMKLKEDIQAYHRNGLLTAIAKKVGVEDISGEARYDGYTFDEMLDEADDAYSSGLATYERIRAIVDEVRDGWPSSDNIRVIVWAS